MTIRFKIPLLIEVDCRFREERPEARAKHAQALARPASHGRLVLISRHELQSIGKHSGRFRVMNSRVQISLADHQSASFFKNGSPPLGRHA
jgi:hypothetical protein